MALTGSSGIGIAPEDDCSDLLVGEQRNRVRSFRALSRSGIGPEIGVWQMCLPGDVGREELAAAVTVDSVLQFRLRKETV